VSTLCRMCPQNCGIEVTVEEGRPVEINASKSHPFNKGWLCAKGRAALDLFNSPRRLKSPLIGQDGTFVPIGWDEALDFAADQLNPTSCLFIDLGPKTGYFPMVHRVISIGYATQDECSVKILFIGLT
jgi:anaerobic selenocysteine-containing dehydrogenase